MKIKIRYENEYQTLEVENMELEKWLNISISEEESQEDYEKRIQDVIERIRFVRGWNGLWYMAIPLSRY
jgi:cell shape-determining protein MreC